MGSIPSSMAAKPHSESSRLYAVVYQASLDLRQFAAEFDVIEMKIGRLIYETVLQSILILVQ